MAVPHIWPSTAVTVSASATSRITWLIPTPHRLTVYASAAPLPDAAATLVIGRLAMPYPSGTFSRGIALTSPSARRLPPESARTRALARLQQMQPDFAQLNRVSTMGELAASLAHEVLHPVATARNKCSGGDAVFGNGSAEFR
jgi:hypothetical protein